MDPPLNDQLTNPKKIRFCPGSQFHPEFTPIIKGDFMPLLTDLKSLGFQRKNSELFSSSFPSTTNQRGERKVKISGFEILNGQSGSN